MQWRPAIYAPIKGLSKWKNYTMSTCTIWAYMYAKLGHMHSNCCKAVETHTCIHTVFSVSLMRFHYRVAVWFMVKLKLTFMLKCSLLWTSWVFRFQIAGNCHQGKQIMPQVQKKNSTYGADASVPVVVQLCSTIIAQYVLATTVHASTCT